MSKRKPPGVTWESFAERQIREAQQAGEFDNLPGFGKPSSVIDEPYDEMWWVRRKVRDERLSVVPPSLQIRLDVEKTMQQVQRMTNESKLSPLTWQRCPHHLLCRMHAVRQTTQQ